MAIKTFIRANMELKVGNISVPAINYSAPFAALPVFQILNILHALNRTWQKTINSKHKSITTETFPEDNAQDVG